MFNHEKIEHFMKIISLVLCFHYIILGLAGLLVRDAAIVVTVLCPEQDTLSTA